MTKKLPYLALFALAACARVEPVDENALDVQDVTTLNVENAADNTAAEDALPAMSWQVDATAQRAAFGLTADDPAFALRCDSDARELELTRYAAAADGAAGTMSLIGNGANLSVPVLGQDAVGKPVLRTQIGDATLLANIKAVFGGEQPVSVATTGAPPLTIGTADEVRAIIDSCQPTAETAG